MRLNFFFFFALFSLLAFAGQSIPASTGKSSNNGNYYNRDNNDDEDSSRKRLFIDLVSSDEQGK